MLLLPVILHKSDATAAKYIYNWRPHNPFLSFNLLKPAAFSLAGCQADILIS